MPFVVGDEVLNGGDHACVVSVDQTSGTMNVNYKDAASRWDVAVPANAVTGWTKVTVGMCKNCVNESAHTVENNCRKISILNYNNV